MSSVNSSVRLGNSSVKPHFQREKSQYQQSSEFTSSTLQAKEVTSSSDQGSQAGSPSEVIGSTRDDPPEKVTTGSQAASTRRTMFFGSPDSQEEVFDAWAKPYNRRQDSIPGYRTDRYDRDNEDADLRLDRSFLEFCWTVFREKRARRKKKKLASTRGSTMNGQSSRG